MAPQQTTSLTHIATQSIPTVVDIAVDDIITISSGKIRSERKSKDLIALSEEPSISLRTGKTCAMDPGLLTGTYTDSLTMIGIADRIRNDRTEDRG